MILLIILEFKVQQQALITALPKTR